MKISALEETKGELLLVIIKFNIKLTADIFSIIPSPPPPPVPRGDKICKHKIDHFAHMVA
jgi:hypothetical protein